MAAEGVFEREGLLVPDLEKQSEWQRTAFKGTDEDVSCLAARKYVLVSRGEAEDGALVLLERMEEKGRRICEIAAEGGWSHGSQAERGKAPPWRQ